MPVLGGFWACASAGCIWANSKYTYREPLTSVVTSAPDEGIAFRIHVGFRGFSLSNAAQDINVAVVALLVLSWPIESPGPQGAVLIYNRV
jgi:hypothetical protein